MCWKKRRYNNNIPSWYCHKATPVMQIHGVAKMVCQYEVEGYWWGVQLWMWWWWWRLFRCRTNLLREDDRKCNTYPYMTTRKWHFTCCRALTIPGCVVVFVDAVVRLHCWWWQSMILKWHHWRIYKIIIVKQAFNRNHYFYRSSQCGTHVFGSCL